MIISGTITSHFVAILMVLLFFSCSEKKKPENINAPKDYSVLTLHPLSATTYSDFPAIIQGEEVIEIRPMVSGYLEEIYVPEGATVRKGQLLFKIKNPQYEQAVVTANAAIKIAVADVNAAKMDVEMVRPFVEKNIVSKYELESAQYTLQSKEAVLAQAQQEEYINTFKKTLLSAGEEVSNALYNYQVATDKMIIRSQQISFLQKSVEFTKELLKYSENTNYTDVLTSEQSLLAARLGSVSDKLQQLQAIIALYRSLGGGWK